MSAGVRRADPARATRDAVAVDDGAVDDEESDDATLVVDGERYSLAGVERVLVLGGGKGSDRVAAALVDALDGRVEGGVVAVDEPTEGVDAGPVSVRVGDHPLPSERGVAAASAVRERAVAADASTLVLAVVSGGASALLPAPVDGVDLDALRSVTRDLLDAGASIGEVNAVRKHVSTLKGGRLAVAASPARVVTVAVSDVVGDDPATIGSGPTAPDGSTYADALDVLSRYDVAAPAVRAHLAAGERGDHTETPGPDDAAFDDAGYHVVASARTAVAGVRAAAEDRGLASRVLSTTVDGEASPAGRVHAAIAREVAATDEPVTAPGVVLSAGETTVTVTGDGTGGPNQAFVLGAAIALAEGPSLPDGVEVAVAAVDTDGRDGSSEAAGAVLAGDALADADALAGARRALADDDATGFFERVSDDQRVDGGLLHSDATGTNVNDLRVIVVAPT
nr:DUF4147 domain-containing protein [Halorubellus sp. JP-L1]